MSGPGDDDTDNVVSLADRKPARPITKPTSDFFEDVARAVSLVAEMMDLIAGMRRDFVELKGTMVAQRAVIGTLLIVETCPGRTVEQAKTRLAQLRKNADDAIRRVNIIGDGAADLAKIHAEAFTELALIFDGISVD
jgi:hypothetical protein